MEEELNLMDEHTEQLNKLADCYHLIFTSDQGQAVLRHLADMCNVSHLAGNMMMDSQATINPAEFMFIREGQDSVLRHIVRMIKLSEEKK